MIGKIRSRFTSAHLIGVVALVFAVGGSVALASVPKNSVNTNKVKNNTLKSADIRNNSLTGADIKGLTGADINEGSLDVSQLNIVLPTPPPSAVQTVGTLLAGNAIASISAGSYTVSVATDAGGNCDVQQISATEDGEFVEADLSEGETAEGEDAIGGGTTDNLDVLNSESDAGPIYALSEDGTNNGVFTLQFNEFGTNNRCAVSMTAIAT
jgi:hypothetical protein